MRLSIVTTLYCSAPYVAEFHQRASAAARTYAGDDYEIVVVNDGSPDNSLELMQAIAEKDDHVVVVNLSRNFGHHKAIMTGLSFANGEEVFLIDSDLEESPEWLADFAAQMKTEACDVVYGVQEARKGGAFERWSGAWFWYLFRKLTGLALSDNLITTRLMTRRYVEALIQHQEREVFLAGLFHIAGFKQRPRVVNKLSKVATTYTLRRKLALFVNSVTSFSSAPLVGIFYFGLIISLCSGLYAAFLVLNKLMFSQPMSGWTSVMASIWLLGGLIISFIGIVGIYLAKVYSEAKRRPYTIVRDVHRKKNRGISG